ncbi:hypothetical protein D3C77_473410 [compost metagenome]
MPDQRDISPALIVAGVFVCAEGNANVNSATFSCEAKSSIFKVKGISWIIVRADSLWYKVAVKFLLPTLIFIVGMIASASSCSGVIDSVGVGEDVDLGGGLVCCDSSPNLPDSAEEGSAILNGSSEDEVFDSEVLEQPAKAIPSRTGRVIDSIFFVFHPLLSGLKRLFILL